MSVLAPAGLSALLLLPLIVLLHLWSARYRGHTLSSTLLWSRVLAEAPRMRPRRLPLPLVLLVLQLVALACGAFALARPGLVAPGGYRRLVVAVDTSLAMSATDVRPTRLARARAMVDGLIDGLRPWDSMTLVDAGTSPRVLTASSDHAVLHRALTGLSVGTGPSSLAKDGPLLAGLQAAGGSHSRVYLMAPLGAPRAALDPLRREVPDMRVNMIGVDSSDRGVAGLTIACPQDAGSDTCEAFARLINTGMRPITTRVTALVDGVPSAEAIALPGQSSTPLRLALPAGARTLEVRLDGHDPLPADDAAWAVVPSPVRRTILLVTNAPDSPLAQALHAIPNLSVRVLAPRDPAVDGQARRADVTVVDSSNAAGIPGNLLLIDPPGDGTLAGKTATVRAPGVTTTDTTSPLLRDVDLSSLVIYTASTAPIPAWAHVDIATNAGPLLFDGITDGRRVAVLLVDPLTSTRPGGDRTGSNLSTLLAFPTLLHNAVQTLAPVTGASVPSGQVMAEPVAHRAGTQLRMTSGRAVAVPAAGDLAALPALPPGTYTLTGGAAGPVAVSAPVPQDPLAQQPPVPVMTALAAPAVAEPRAMPWEIWTPAILLALLVLSGEWWYYTRRT